MRVKRFIGDNVAEAMSKVKYELGPEAVILQTRQIRVGGIFGLFGRPRVEITAAIDYERLRPNTGYNNIRTDTNLSSGSNSNAYGVNLAPFSEGINAAAASLQPNTTGEAASLKEEIHSLQEALAKMSGQMEDWSGNHSAWPPQLRKWAKGLSQAGLNDKTIRRLLRPLQESMSSTELEDDSLVRSRLEESVQRICSRTGVIQPGVRKPKVVALIGPTGVGKTTTIGKLAAAFGIVDKRKVALVTTDTFRVAAVEQLKTLGQIIGVPVEVAMTPSGLKEILNNHSDKEIIFLDTAGRSPQHELHMHELKAYMDAAKPHLAILVLSATTNLADQQRVFSQFKPLATHLILTKLDETACQTALLNLIDTVTLPICYITNGQNVPNDIEIATPDSLARIILKEVNLGG